LKRRRETKRLEDETEVLDLNVNLSPSRRENQERITSGDVDTRQYISNISLHALGWKQSFGATLESMFSIGDFLPAAAVADWASRAAARGQQCPWLV
jgi:hypothetical protein